MNKKISLGIDVGTIYSTASGIPNGRVEEFAFPGDGPQIPSAAYLPDEDDSSVITGLKAMRPAYKSPEDLFVYCKRQINDHGSKFSNAPVSSSRILVTKKMHGVKRRNRAK